MGSKSTTACFPSAGSSNQSSSQYRHHLLLSFCRCRAQESAGRCGEVRAPVKWRYRGATRAHRGPRLKSEWQAAEAIKIELLSRAARELLEQTGVQATFSLTRTRARTNARTHTQARTHARTHTPLLHSHVGVLSYKELLPPLPSLRCGCGHTTAML